MVDKNGVEIKAGDTLFNPHDAKLYYEVVEDGAGNLYLGDLASPLEKYAPQLWWEVVANEIFPGTRTALANMGRGIK